jgi:bleomycin hydrolase
MRKVFLLVLTIAFVIAGQAQTDGEMALPKVIKPKEINGKPLTKEEKMFAEVNFTIEKSNTATSVKDQAKTNTCWCFSTISLVESQCLKNNFGELDLSEMFSVKNIYVEKAKNYILRQGNTKFGEGGMGHDLIKAIANYGTMPEEIYSGLNPGQVQHNHLKMVQELKKYLDSIISIKPVPQNWMFGYKNILDNTLGFPPETFTYNGKIFTPKKFADEVLKFNASDYVNITSFTHHNYYEPFILEVPDNFSNGAYYNVPLNEMIQLTKDALNKGYTVLWDADVTNDGFQQRFGSAVDLENLPADLKTKNSIVTGDKEAGKIDAERRQALFENLTTQDDHLMHITGFSKSKNGARFFLVKNSWGDVGPMSGYINVSEAYFGINTISIIVPKAALSKAMLEKLKIK